MSNNLNQALSLFERMKAKGQLQPSSQQLIVANLNATNAVVVKGSESVNLGTEDPIVLLLVLDNTGSVIPQRSAVQEGLRKLIIMGKKIFKKQGTEVLLGVILFGATGEITPLIPFTLVDKIDPKVIDNYNPKADATALLDGTFAGVIGSAGYGFSLHEDGIRGGKRIMVVLTDGGENETHPQSAIDKKCAEIAMIMNDLRRPKQNVFGLIGVGPDSDFRPIGRKMGFKDANIVSISRSAGGFAAALELVSSSMELHSVAQSTGQPLNEPDGDVLIPTNIVTDADAEEDFFS